MYDLYVCLQDFSAGSKLCGQSPLWLKAPFFSCFYSCPKPCLLLCLSGTMPNGDNDQGSSAESSEEEEEIAEESPLEPVPAAAKAVAVPKRTAAKSMPASVPRAVSPFSPTRERKETESSDDERAPRARNRASPSPRREAASTKKGRAASPSQPPKEDDRTSCPVCWARVSRHASSLSQHQFWSEHCNTWRAYNMQWYELATGQDLRRGVTASESHGSTHGVECS